MWISCPPSVTVSATKPLLELSCNLLYKFLVKAVENKCECSGIRLNDDPTLLKGANEFLPARSVFLDRFG
jgi:hypothetical protein